MKAIILCAGEGSRMRPLTLTKPKTMLPVAGKPIMQYNIESLRENGIKVLEMHSAELSRGRGGPRCMSMPLVRADKPWKRIKV